MAKTEDANASVVDALLRQVTLARAATLARAGRYADAELLLDPADGKAALDLLARIRAQQGRLAEAQALWLEASHQDPGNSGYEAALGRLAGVGRWSPQRFWLRWLAAATLLLVVAGGLSAWLLAQSRRDSALTSELRLTRTTLRPPGALNLNLAIAGIRERADGRETVLSFDLGLFEERAALTPAASKVLKDLGKRLEPYSSQLAVLVLGYCDDRPLLRTTRYQDNRALALARADAVARYLAANTRLPASIFTLQAGADAPFPNDTPANRARNRTVEIRVARAP